MYNKSDERNIYFQMMAMSKNDAEAISEAGRIAEKFGGPMGVSVHHCGSNNRRICSVLPNGTVVFPKEK